jgi:hypothetical protein
MDIDIEYKIKKEMNMLSQQRVRDSCGEYGAMNASILLCHRFWLIYLILYGYYLVTVNTSFVPKV